MCAKIWCFWPLTASTTSEVKNDHAHVITQDIWNKFIEINFCVGCMVSQPNCLFQHSTTMSLINKIHIIFTCNPIIFECSILKQTIWPWNHTSYTKVYFNEFVANVLGDNIGTVIFDLWGHGGCWRPKTPLGGQKWHKGVDLLKKVFNTTSTTP